MDMVKIGTRLPQGIMLRIGQWYKGPDESPLVKDIATHHIVGSGSHIGSSPGGIHADDFEVPFTEIPAEHWASWFEMNKDSDLVTSGAVFKSDGKDNEGDKPVVHESNAKTEPKPISPLPSPEKIDPPIAGEPVKPEAGHNPEAKRDVPVVAAPATVKPESQMSESELEHATRP